MDPLKRDIQVFPLENPLNSNDDIKIRPELEHCKSENHNFWLSKCDSYLLFIIYIIREMIQTALKLTSYFNDDLL